MVNILMIIAPGKFRDEEYSEPRAIFEKNNYNIDLASIEKKEYIGMMGLKVTTNINFDEVEVDKYDGIVISGGIGTLKIINNSKLLEIIKEFYEQKKIIGAICLAGMILANADILKEKNATVYETTESLNLFKQKGVIYSNKNVVVDGLIVTANGPNSAKEFGIEITKLI